MHTSRGAYRSDPAQRHLSIEHLEPRHMLAVTTSLNIDGVLTITGDGDADDIAILGTGAPGEITISGRNGTLVDGMASKTIPGVTSHLLANLGEGDDVVNVDNVYVAGDFELRSGNGNDQMVLGATNVVSTTGHCWVMSGAGNDLVRLEDYKVFVVDQLFIALGGGGARSTISMVGASALGAIMIFGADFGINDTVVRSVTGASGIDIRGGAPINNIAVFNSAASGALLIRCGDGQNSIYLDTCYTSRFIQVNSWSSGRGYSLEPPTPAPYNIDDTVTIARCQTPQIVVHTGLIGAMAFFGGNDTINIYGNYIVGPPTQVTLPTYAPVHVVYVETGEGNDSLTATYNVMLGEVLVSMFKGDDMLALVGNLVTAFASADGGEGTNRLNLFGNQFSGFAATRFQ